MYLQTMLHIDIFRHKDKICVSAVLSAVYQLRREFLVFPDEQDKSQRILVERKRVTDDITYCLKVLAICSLLAIGRQLLELHPHAVLCF